jgi:acyl-CoA oxidase
MDYLYILFRKGEVKILDYKTQQYRVLPQLARALCFCFAGHFTMNLYKKVMSDVKDGNASEMASLHAITSGLKSVCSYQMSIGVEQCRLSCGGHG